MMERFGPGLHFSDSFTPILKLIFEKLNELNENF